MSGWLIVLAIGGVGWWLLGFPPGWGWIVGPILPTMPVSWGMVLAFGAVVVGLYGGLVWLRNNV